MTFSVSKSITLLHASALANAAQAEVTGDRAAAKYWRQAAADVWACIEAGNQAALDYLQREAGYTRSGYHGRQVNGVTTGRWEDAHQWVIGSFPQHTSRDGDPQLHIHNLVLNRLQRERDGAWRTLDSKALYEHRGAAAAIAAMVMESKLSREFGTGWISRPDGHGREIRGVSQALMEKFSSRRHSICALTEQLAREYEAHHGHALDARALGQLRLWANHATRARKDAEPLDLNAEVRCWAAHARATENGALGPVMPHTTSRRGPVAAPDQARQPCPLFELTAEQEHDLITLALATLQESQPTWRKADLIRHLGELLPDDIICRDDQTAAALLEQLADRVLAGGAGAQVLALEAPEHPQAPQSLRRADGRSVYQPHGATRYATMVQLSLEERLTALARQTSAPHLEPAQAAQLLGAEQAQLEAQLGADADPDAAQQVTGSGLRLDQASAAFAVLTSDRQADILVGPAGSGKTYTAACAAALWQAGAGETYGLAVSQAARNVLHEAGVTTADNIAGFLGHLKGRREALGAKRIMPRTLLILDEASTIPIADLTAILRLAADHDCKVLITGDHEHAVPAAADPHAATRHRELARVWQALHAKATSVATTLTEAHETRRQWATLTAPTRNMALAADLELRRRHPDLKLKALNAAEPATAADSPASVPAPSIPQAERNARRAAGAYRLPDLAAADIGADVPDRLERIAQRARQAQQLSASQARTAAWSTCSVA